MKHLGDITKINGADVAPVNVVIGGSPCQDLSVAGRRAGLAGARSGLFMEQIRVIKEMRNADESRGRTGTAIRPRFMVWENVPGAFSSNKGADFGAVLQETVRIVCEEVPAVPMPDKGWPTAGCLVDVEGHWSVAWRVFDAQFWGVPQRRRRIALVADFGGATAPEILFERKSVPGDSAQSGTARKGTSAHFEEHPGTAGAGGMSCAVAYRLSSLASNSMKSSNPHSGCRQVDVAATLDASTPDPAKNQGGILIVDAPSCCIYDARGNGNGKVAPAITDDHNGCVSDYSAIVCRDNQDLPTIFRQQSFGEYVSDSVSSTIKQRDGRDATDLVVKGTATVRRLTPLECERLQGYPDGWTQIGRVVDFRHYELGGEEYIETVREYTNSAGKRRKTSDSARYKALGNSIALPPWTYVLQKLSVCCGADHTMASLFDGIGGFPLIWERINGQGACLWASEIEEFPIAVTKKRFLEIKGVSEDAAVGVAEGE